MLHYWKSPTDLPAYLVYKAKEVNPGPMETLASRRATICTAPIGCILLVLQDVSSNRHPIINLV
jgi:hypothetical protein